jgi:hypothetical protein
MIRPILATIAAVPLLGAVVAIDRPADWLEPSASHHGKHGLGGIPLGVASASLVSLATGARAAKYAVAIGTGAVVGVGYEVAMGWGSTGTYMDPVDALWVVSGAIVGAALVDLTGQAVTVVAGPHQVAVAIAFRF